VRTRIRLDQLELRSLDIHNSAITAFFTFCWLSLVAVHLKGVDIAGPYRAGQSVGGWPGPSRARENPLPSSLSKRFLRGQGGEFDFELPPLPPGRSNSPPLLQAQGRLSAIRLPAE
jgi:hypothetical protein